MKKLFISILAIVATAMFVSGSFAEDRLSIGGSFYVRAWSQDGYNGEYSATYNNDDSVDFIEQKLRLQGTLAIADDVKAVVRTDIGDGHWGTDFHGTVTRPGYQAANGDRYGQHKIDFDRAYIQINKENWSLTAGQQYIGFGIAQVLDVQPVGLKFNVKFNDAFNTTLVYAKLDENGTLNDDGNSDDIDLYGANVSMTTDAFDGNLFYVMHTDGTSTDDSPWAIGLNGSGSLGMVNLTSELAYLGGDTNNGTVDYSGLQFYLRGDGKINDMFKVGSEVFYAQAADKGDIQLTNLGDWDSFTVMGLNTPIGTYVSAFSSWDVFDPSGNSAGVQGITLLADVTPLAELTLGAKIGYFEPEDDGMTDLNDVTSFNAYVSYLLASNTTVSLTYFYSSPDYDGTTSDDAATALVGQLLVTF